MTDTDKLNLINRNSKYVIRYKLGSHPMTYLLLGLSKRFWKNMVSVDTTICIEGFLRSANSFTLHSFLKDNPEARVAHRLHVPQQIIRAAKLKIPCIVLICNPLDSLASLLIIDNILTISLAINSYCEFYKLIFHIRESYAVTRFQNTISNFSPVVAAVNHIFGTQFNATPGTAADGERIFTYLREHHKNKKQAKYLLPVPTSEKETLKQKIRKNIQEHPRYPEASEIFSRFTRLASP
jgi:hypothetical protein